MWFANRWPQVFEDNPVVATFSINMKFQHCLGGERDTNLSWFPSSDILLSISKTDEGFDTALGVSVSRRMRFAAHTDDDQIHRILGDIEVEFTVQFFHIG